MISSVKLVDNEAVHAGHYVWRLDADHPKHIVLVVDGSAGLQIRRFDGTYSEALYGEFLARIDL